LLINVEDLWLETQQQNIPGTRNSYPNWKKRAKYSIDEFRNMPDIADTLRIVNRLRKKDN